jgi:hypothetical protein
LREHFEKKERDKCLAPDSFGFNNKPAKPILMAALEYTVYIFNMGISPFIELNTVSFLPKTALSGNR